LHTQLKYFLVKFHFTQPHAFSQLLEKGVVNVEVKLHTYRFSGLYSEWWSISGKHLPVPDELKAAVSPRTV
jgi:hypothetical protein